MKRLLLLTLALIIYGSFYPWHWKPIPPQHFVEHFLFHSWPARFGMDEYQDILINLILYIPPGMFAYLAFDSRRPVWVRLLLSTSICSAVSLAVELTQSFIPTRSSSLLDFVCNTLSAAAGALLGWKLGKKRFTAPVLLVFLWLASQAAFWGGILVRAFIFPLLSRLAMTALIFGWVLAGYFSADYLGRRQLAARALGIAVIAYLVFRQLIPFHLSPVPEPFEWVPFRASLVSGVVISFALVFEKCFYYATAIWLLRVSGLRISLAGILVCALLAITEALQRYLPGRTAESTDPLLALIFTYILWEVEREHARMAAA